MIRDRSRRPDDAALWVRLRDLAHQRHRFGYRRLHVLLRRDGEAASRTTWRVTLLWEFPIKLAASRIVRFSA